MNLSRLSIDQPVLAIVASIFILVVGAIAYSRLPIAEYPEIAPPAVVIQTQYPGASAQVVADTVATPIEQEVNGVDDMLYMYSQSTSDGGVTITVTFKLGTDPDKAQVLVRNAVSIAEPRLPEEVRRFGVVTKKNSPNLMLVVFLMSPDDTYDQLYISNYALRRVRDPLLRLDGVGDIRMYGARDYSMRLWLDPDKMAEFGLAAADLLASVRSQNVQIAGGQIAEPPISDRAFQPNLTFLGRLTEPDAFENIIVKSSADGRLVRLKDIARIELGALSYSTNSFLLRKPAVALAVTQRPGTNALATADSIKALMADLEKEFPKGLVYSIAYNPTDFIAESVRELLKTVYEAIALVVFVVILFLQRWRAAIIPIIAIPVSLIGTFAVMAAFGLSINNLTLFGLVLAVGIVVDDAIVVVENVERHLSDGANPLDAARLTMDEVGTALISIALVLAAVFVPTAFLGGISGQFFRQFAIAIAVATVISCFNSLTLSPALSSLILKSHTQARAPGRWSVLARPFNWFFGHFNRGFDRSAELYGRTVRWATALAPAFLAVYAVLIAITAWAVYSTPRGFIPAQDRGYVIVAIQLPSGSSLARTTDVVRRAEEIILDTPGVARAPSFAGFNGATFTLSPSAAALFPVFAPYEERLPHKLTAERITADLRTRLSAIDDAVLLVLPPPSVPGIGNGGGFAMRLEDRAGRGTDVLAAATEEMVNAARAEPALTSVFTPFSNGTPQIFVDIDRTRAQMLNVPIANVTEALETYFGSSYVNDFNILGRVYRVTAQADLPFRRGPEDSDAPEGAQRPWTNGADRQRPAIPRHHRAGSCPALQSLSRVRDRRRARPRRELDHGAGHHDTTCPPDPAGRPRLRVERPVLPGEPRRNRRALHLSALRSVRLSRIGRAIWQLDAAARDHFDRPDVPVCRHRRGPAHGAGCKRADPDRIRRSGRTGGEERDPHRRIRKAAGGAGAEHDGCSGSGLPAAAAADPDDLVRVHSGRAAARHLLGRRLRDAPGRRRRRVLRHDRRDPVRIAVHTGLLCGGPPAVPGKRTQAGTAGRRAGQTGTAGIVKRVRAPVRTCAPLPARVARDCRDHHQCLGHRSFVGDGQVDARLAAGRSHGIEPRERAAGKLHGRTSRRQVDDAHVAPEHAGAQTGAECLGAGFLGGETLGVSFDPSGAAFGLCALEWREDAIEEALTVPFDRALDAADIDEIGSYPEDHARPRSIAARMVFTASAKPEKTPSPIRK